MRNDSVPFSAYNEGDGRALLRELLNPMKGKQGGAEQNPSERGYRVPKKVEGQP
jgi:hypothetical protein